MPVAQMGVLDLSIITDRLIELLDDAIANSPLWTLQNPQFSINTSGNAPDVLRNGSDCELSLYLFHVSEDRFQKNTPISGLRTPLIPFQPLALDLYYLLNVFAGSDYVKEQQAMSVALNCFHQNPIVRETVIFGTTPVNEEFVLSMEVQAADDLARLWQATTAPMRLSSVYKVSVVFMSPEAPAQAIAPNPRRVVLSADATTLPFAQFGQLTGTRRTVTYSYPSGPVPVSQQQVYELSPAVAAAGQHLQLLGGGLNGSTSGRVYLIAPGGVEVDVTAWKAANPAPPASVLQTDSLITLDLPASGGAAPASTPPPGVYQLCAGSSTTAGDASNHRTNAVPVAIAARIDVTADPPVLADAGGLFSITGLGFVAGATEVLIGTVALTASAGAPGAGEFSVAGTSAITFRLPATLLPGRHALRVRVNQVESDPSWWVDVP